jgi:hypothetical protein
LTEEPAGRRAETGLKTFRLPVALVEALEKEAEDRGMSSNALASSILTRHVNWDRKAEKFGYMSIYKPYLVNLVKSMDDKELERIGREVLPSEMKDLAQFMLGGTSPKQVLEAFGLLGRFMTNSNVEIKTDGEDYRLTIHHDLGPKWNLLSKAGLDELVRNSFKSQPTFTIGETIIEVRFSLSRPPQPI